MVQKFGEEKNSDYRTYDITYIKTRRSLREVLEGKVYKKNERKRPRLKYFPQIRYVEHLEK